MKKKFVAIGSVLSFATVAAVASCGTTATPTSSSTSSTPNKVETIAFKDAATIATDDTLTASTGSSFNGALPSYENDGNENTTTRAGLRVRKSSVISAIKNNLGLNSENKINSSKRDAFFAAINKLLPADKALVPANFADADLDTVEITIVPSTDAISLFSDLVPSSLQSPIVTQNVTITFYAKDGKTIGKDKASRVTISGMQKIRLTDYRRVDTTTLMAADDKPVIQVESVKPSSVTLNSIITALDKHFDISNDKYATPFFPIWGIKADGTPLYETGTGASKSPVKHSLDKALIADLQKLYKGTASEVTAGRSFGNFPAARVGRAVEKVYFALPTGVDGTKVITGSGTGSDEYEVTLVLKQDFIKHWSWGATKYSNMQKTFDLPVTFKVKFATAAPVVNVAPVVSTN